MSDRPLVSVVVGVMNGAATLERTIDSFVQQRLARKELIVKDGGSTDGTLEILERRSSDITIWTTERDGGLYEAWNSALDRCRGDYVCFLGCDDVFAEPTSLETVARHATEAKAPDLICSLAAMTAADGTFLKVMGRAWNWTAMRRSQIIAHPGMLHKRTLFERYGKFDPAYRIAGDYEFLLRLDLSTTARFVDQITVRMGANGMSHKHAATTHKEIWRAQATHSGVIAATRNLAANRARFRLRKLLGKR